MKGINPDYLKKHGIEAPRQPHKYGAEPTEYNGKTYPSRLEANCRAQLDRLRAAGLVTEIQEQVRFDLTPEVPDRKRKTVYVADFVVHYRTGEARTVDAKGAETRVFQRKRRQFESLYGPLDVVKRWEDMPTEGRNVRSDKVGQP